MEPMWQQNNNPGTFAALQPFPDAVDLNATLQFVSNQRNQLDNHISRQLPRRQRPGGLQYDA
jgi:hypothetical protein